ncbi:hypothetical protein AURDEDRAFT_164987 [Auricularia subglabra TFB-10046 SS5]|nr:hypothetical protein AURDEDRAFT_164987 [Auricularia subglabra TFB-10046 SS5]
MTGANNDARRKSGHGSSSCATTGTKGVWGTGTSDRSRTHANEARRAAARAARTARARCREASVAAAVDNRRDGRRVALGVSSSMSTDSAQMSFSSGTTGASNVYGSAALDTSTAGTSERFRKTGAGGVEERRGTQCSGGQEEEQAPWYEREVESDSIGEDHVCNAENTRGVAPQSFGRTGGPTPSAGSTDRAQPYWLPPARAHVHCAATGEFIEGNSKTNQCGDASVARRVVYERGRPAG